jgi:hypothetical protein
MPRSIQRPRLQCGPPAKADGASLNCILLNVKSARCFSFEQSKKCFQAWLASSAGSQYAPSSHETRLVGFCWATTAAIMSKTHRSAVVVIDPLGNKYVFKGRVVVVYWSRCNTFGFGIKSTMFFLPYMFSLLLSSSTFSIVLCTNSCCCPLEPW